MPRLASTACVYRIESEIDLDGTLHTSSLVLKILARSDSEHVPREALMYASGVHAHLPAGLASPTWHGNAAISAKLVGIWLEDLRDDPKDPWTPDRSVIAARHLGRLAGSRNEALLSSAATRPIRRFWADRDYVAATVSSLASAPRSGLMQRAFPDDIIESLLLLWEQRHAAYERGNQVPLTLCHGDPQRRNLFARANRTIAIDWANFATAPVGMDIATLIFYAMAYFDIEFATVTDLEGLVVAAYAQGLRESGTRIAAGTVWLSYAIQLVFGIGLLETGPVLRLVTDEATQRWAVEFHGHPIETILHRRAAISAHLVKLGERVLARLRDETTGL